VAINCVALRLATASLGLAAILSAHPAAADAVADFYKDRTLSLVVGHEVGTGFDTYARVLARHFGRHLPGHPAIVVQNMVGASGIIAANWLYNVAPRDGTVVSTFVQTTVFDSIFGNAVAKFEPAKYTWIGNADEGVGICGVSKISGVQNIEDLRRRETIFGGTGMTGPLASYAFAVKNLLGAQIRVVVGYKGSASVKLAIQRGEVEGVCGVSLSTIKSQWQDDLRSGAFKLILQLSGKPQPEFKGAPHVDDFPRTDDERQLFELVFGPQALGRIFVSPPEMPVARRDALRAAFTATMQDPQFLADADKTKIDIAPMTGAQVERFIARVSSLPPAAVARAKQAMRGN
jgi:tripartite-type tricarboxylate transporter receptor subunit TctC